MWRHRSGSWPINPANHLMEFHTMSVIRVGSSTNYGDGWDHVFGGKHKGGSARGKTPTGPAKAAKKAAPKKAAAKKSSKRK